MEHFPGRGLSVEAPPVDSSLTKGFRAGGMAFLSYCGVSASSAPANGGADVTHAHLSAVLCVCVASFSSILCELQTHVWGRTKTFVRARARHEVHSWREGGLYSMQITLPILQQLLLCVGPSVSCWLPKCLRQPCFCLRLCPLPCPAHISEVRWLLMAVPRQRAHFVATLKGQGRGQGRLGGVSREEGPQGGLSLGKGRVETGKSTRYCLPLCTHVTLAWQPLLCACLNCPSQLALISHSVRMSKHSVPSHPRSNRHKQICAQNTNTHVFFSTLSLAAHKIPGGQSH